MLARTVQCYLLCFTRVFQQSMRNVLTNVLVLMAQDFPISTSEKGSLLAAIPLGYFMTQVPGGALADRIGAKNVMLMALTLSACCCLVLPTAFEYGGVYGLLATLTMMGAVQGPMFPTSSVFLSRWMPKAQPGQPDEKAWGTSMLDIGISVGTLLIIPTTTFLAEAVGWRHTYHIIGVASLCFCATFAFFGASSPAECWYISADELSFLEKNVAKPKAKTADDKAKTSSMFANIVGMPSAVALHPGLWAVFGAHMAFNLYAAPACAQTCPHPSACATDHNACALRLSQWRVLSDKLVAHLLQGRPWPHAHAGLHPLDDPALYQPRRQVLQPDDRFRSREPRLLARRLAQGFHRRGLPARRDDAHPHRLPLDLERVVLDSVLFALQCVLRPRPEWLQGELP